MLKVNNLPNIHDKILNSDFKGALLSSIDRACSLSIPHLYYKHITRVVFTFNLVIYMRQQSCLKQEFNDQILALTGGGFLESWTSRFIDKEYTKDQTKQEPTQLNIDKLSGGFDLLILGLAIATFIFLMELLSYRIKSLRYFLNHL